jgi:cytoskeletal protein CcmA (bactofilin family)
MWKKNDPETPANEPQSMPIEPVMSKSPTRTEAATIGPSITVRGDVTGEEDLIVQGLVEGTVTLKQNNVTVGKDGRIKANVHARIIEIEGTVEGDLHGDEQVVVRRSGNIHGNVIAPRVTLEDGCRFKGSIDMDVGRAVASKAPSAEKAATDKVAGIKSAEKSDAKSKDAAEWKVESKVSGS